MASKVNAAAATVLKRAFRGEWFDVGHGVGLEVHEWPFIGYQRIIDEHAYKDSTLKENMVISLEPTVFIEGVGEMQLEDQFVIKKRGSERLNDIPQEIIEI